jgi:ParB-like chromosome segregation protein Spo0J
MTTDLTMPQIDIDLIDVEDEFNARKKFDPEELKALAQTIEDTGFVQGIKVVAKPDGRYNS